MPKKISKKKRTKKSGSSTSTSLHVPVPNPSDRPKGGPPKKRKRQLPPLAPSPTQGLFGS